VGRCGAFTAAEATGVTPDIITMAKGLGSGLPVAAMLSRPSLTSVLGLGDLGSTFGGGPVPCAAALATLQVIDAEGLIENAMAVGDYLRAGATGLGVTRVHGRGLLLGLELDRPAREVQQALFERRILTGTSTDPRTLRLLPPLVFSREEAGLLLAALSEVLS
jgi:acetylornithine aminotransferase